MLYEVVGLYELIKFPAVTLERYEIVWVASPKTGTGTFNDIT